MQKRDLDIKRCGFTIVEMLLVVVLIGLLSGAGGWVCIGTYKRLVAKKAMRDFFCAAKYAKILAIEKASKCKLVLDVNANKFQLVIDELNEQTGETWPVVIRNEYFKPVVFEGGVKFEKIHIMPVTLEDNDEEYELYTIVFFPNGTAQSAVIQIGDGENHYTASIAAATGKTKVYSGTAENVRVVTIDLDEQ